MAVVLILARSRVTGEFVELPSANRKAAAEKSAAAFCVLWGVALSLFRVNKVL